MRGLIEHGAFVLAVTCLAAAGLRVATAAGAQGVVRVLAAAVVAVAAAVLETLVLGLADLSGSRPALLAAAVATWALARLRLPNADPRAAAELGAWWRSAGPAPRAAAGAGAVLTLGWVAWQMRHPHLGYDSLTYHLQLPAEYLRVGTAGALTPVMDGLPVESYPVTSEVFMTWALALSGAWPVASILSPALMVTLVAAGGAGLRELRVPTRTAWLAVAALVTAPATVFGLNSGLATDLATLTWLVVAAALAAASRSNPRLLALALVAAGLSFGTKTTGAVVLLVVIGGAAWAARGSLRALARPLGVAVIAALGVGGIWSIRNTVMHGSPLWPLVATSFGDPVPPSLASIRSSFISHPLVMLDGRVGEYLKLLGGSAALLPAGIAAPLLGRSRASLAAGLLVLVTALAWSAAPYTGADKLPPVVAAGTVRYLLPCLAVACVALALAARDGGRRARAPVDIVLGVVVVASLLRVDRWGFPYVPRTAAVVGLVLLGAVAGLASRVSSRGIVLPRAARLSAAAGLGALVAAGLAASADGYVSRHAGAMAGDGRLIDAAVARPDWDSGSFPIAMTPLLDALLAGDRLQHPVELMAPTSSCAQVRRRRREGWVVLVSFPPTAQYQRLGACLRPEVPVHAGPYDLYAG